MEDVGTILKPHLLPRCYQDRTNQPHQTQCRVHLVLLILVGFWLAEVVSGDNS
jgi:hypothetical protein